MSVALLIAGVVAAPGSPAAAATGVRYYVDRTSPFKATRLVRTPGFRKTEPSPRDRIHAGR